MRRQFWLGAASTTALLAVAVASGAAAQARADMQSEPRADAVDIVAGRTALVGRWEVGVTGVTGTGSLKKASLVVAAYPAGVPAEFSMHALEHYLVPLGDGLHRVLWISPGTGKQKGQVGISAVPIQQPGAPGPAGVYVVADGWLRVNGPATHGASDIQVTAWNKGQSPASVDVQWRPSQYAVQDTDPKDVQHAHLRVGSSLDVGGRALTVSAIEPQTADHPAWVRFEMAGSGSR
jgi:hypothetical protein